MPDQTRETLKRLAEAMRRANGQDGAASPATPAPGAPGPAERPRPATAVPDRRAEMPPNPRPRP